MQTECISGQLEFEGFDGRHVVAAFDGGAVTSDAGALLLRETDRAIRLIERVAACFSDGRDQGSSSTRCRHWSASGLLRSRSATRMSTTTTGYASIRCWRCSATASRPSARIVRRWRARARRTGWNMPPATDAPVITRSAAIARLQDVFVDVFLDAHGKAPRESVLDLDATPCTATRKAGSSTAYYDGYGYLPLY